MAGLWRQVACGARRQSVVLLYYGTKILVCKMSCLACCDHP